MWLAFIEFCSTIYVGYPNRIRSDRESGVTSDLFQDIEMTNRTELHLSAIKAHNSIGIGERYHVQLTIIYNFLRGAHPQLERQLLLPLARKGMNEFMGQRVSYSHWWFLGLFPHSNHKEAPTLAQGEDGSFNLGEGADGNHHD